MGNSTQSTKLLTLDNISNIANKTIPLNDGKRVVTYKRGITKDIISECLDMVRLHWKQTERFAANLKGTNDVETMKNCYYFVKRNIKYVLDPDGYQFIKSPSAIWYMRYGDCKSYSIFLSSLLLNLGIPHVTRWVSYDEGKIEHVYVVGYAGGKPYVIDCCMHPGEMSNGFNTEKPYHHKQDYDMTKIVRITGIGDVRSGTTVHIQASPQMNIRPLMGTGNSYNPDMTDGELELRIARQRLEIESGLAANKLGKNHPKVKRYKAAVDAMHKAVIAADEGGADQLEVVIDDLEDKLHDPVDISGVGKLFKSKSERKAYHEKKKEIKRSGGSKKDQKAALKDLRKKEGGPTIRFLQKASDAVKKGTKALANIASAPARLAAKGILEITLPKAAPFFLYLFVNDPTLIAKLPPKAKIKRDKASKVADIITGKLGMKKDHFMGIVRNGIMKQMGASPETILAKMISPNNVAGIGFLIPPGLIMIVLGLIKKLFSGGGAPDVSLSENDSPDESDFSADSLNDNDRSFLAKQVRQQTDDPTGEGGDDGSGDGGNGNGNGGTGGRSIWNSFHRD
jgi:hypothetical protein